MQIIDQYDVEYVAQGRGTSGSRAKFVPPEHLIWPASSEFSLPKLEYDIASKWSSM